MIVGVSALILRSSTVSDNRVVANVGSSADSGPSGSALEFGGTATISNTRITGNTATVMSQAGTTATAGAVAAFAPEEALISNSVISGNVQSASSTTGPATVRGNGIVNNGVLELRNVQINDNAGTATGPTGLAQGGGIWNGLLFNPLAVLTLVNTAVTRNTLSASAGLTVQGGGMFTQFPVTATNSRIEHNAPDDSPVAEVSERSRANAVAVSRAAPPLAWVKRASEAAGMPCERVIETVWIAPESNRNRSTPERTSS